MIKLKRIRLKNYCGYRDFQLDLTDGGNIKTWAMFFGPNGIGKSNIIRAVDLLASPITKFTQRKNFIPFRKLKYNKDYIPAAELLYDNVEDLLLEAVFDIDGVEKRVVLEDNIKGQITAGRQLEEGEISGIKINELTMEDQGVIFIDADSRNLMNQFQLIDSFEKPFCDFAEAVYGFKCYCPKNATVATQGITYLMDFVIEKPCGTKVHYKRFSDGEKKIATLLSGLFKRAHKTSPTYENSDILIIDNIAMHIYWKRHMTLIEKLEKYFGDKQIIATTHSPIIIQNMDKKYLYDLEDLVGAVKPCQPV
jgi:predicted ATP-binding protein involved in virulence